MMGRKRRGNQKMFSNKKSDKITTAPVVIIPQTKGFLFFAMWML